MTTLLSHARTLTGARDTLELLEMLVAIPLVAGFAWGFLALAAYLEA